jgi:1-acyl-sn-glycerol-3-phosphate acyltransferase
MSQLEPILVGMFIGWSSKKFMFFFVDRKNTKVTKMSKRVFSVFVCEAFIFQVINLYEVFIMFLIRFYKILT